MIADPALPYTRAGVMAGSLQSIVFELTTVNCENLVPHYMYLTLLRSVPYIGRTLGYLITRLPAGLRVRGVTIHPHRKSSQAFP